MRFKLRSAAVDPSAAPPPPPNMSDRPPPRPECNNTPAIVPIIDTMLMTNITYSITSRTGERLSSLIAVRSARSQPTLPRPARARQRSSVTNGAWRTSEECVMVTPSFVVQMPGTAKAPMPSANQPAAPQLSTGFVHAAHSSTPT